MYAAPTLVDPSTLLVTIGGGVMCLNATLAPNVQRLVWVTYVNPNPYAGANFNYLAPVPTQYGVAIVASSGLLSAVTYNNGSVAWSYALDCSAITVEGQVAIAVCGELVAIDVVTGTFLGQIGVQIINRGLLTVPNPSNPLLPTVIFETDISGFYSTVTITTFRNVTAVVPQQATPLPPISPNATLPPGFTPEVPAPSQQPPSVLAYQYFPSAPNSVLDWQWPSAADPNTTAHSRTTLLQSPNLLVALDTTNNTLLAFNPVTYQALWQTPIPNVSTTPIFLGYRREPGCLRMPRHRVLYRRADGVIVGNNSDAALTNAINNGNVESPLAAAPGLFCYTYYVYGYVASALPISIHLRRVLCRFGNHVGVQLSFGCSDLYIGRGLQRQCVDGVLGIGTGVC
jgi:outer membrane protein assembly factor BamB